VIPIKIIKYENPTPLNDIGDILRPFVSWNETLTGGGWYSKVPEKFYTDKLYYPLTAVSQNPWTALKQLGVEHREFKKLVEYICPYNEYVHFWSVPVLVFTSDVKNWTARYKTGVREDMYLDKEWMRKFFPPKVKDALPFTKIQRALLGPGYTEMTIVSDGSGYLYDALVALDNGDFLGMKVWMWFNK
jgi:hypothetical protein